MDSRTREHLRRARSERLVCTLEHRRLRYGDGWCYGCGREIAPGEPVDTFRKFCSRVCACEHADATKRGYPEA